MSVHESPVYLYARNFYADLHNFEILQGLEEDFTVYDSKDSGNQKYLDKILAPAKLTLEQNSPERNDRNCIRIRT
jgi:hypothetical protein